MRTLFLDLSAPQGRLALVSDGGVTCLAIDHRAGDHEVVKAVDGLLRDAELSTQDLERIACITGPGGFTSLRVGVALANALAWALNIPLAGIHASDLWRAVTGMTDGVWLQSTKKELLFIRGFGSFAKQWPEPVTIDLGTLLSVFASEPGTAFCGQLMSEHETSLTKEGAVRADGPSFDAALSQVLAKASFEKEPLEPWYGRGY